MENISPIKSAQCEATSPVFTTMSSNLLLPFDKSPLQEGKESLGILHPGFEEESNFFSGSDKEHLSFKDILYFEDSDIGRESLGILQINNLNINFDNEDEKVPSFLENVNNSNKIFDTGFLISSPSRRLVTTSTQYSDLSFNNTSLDYPSKIITITKNGQTNKSIFTPSYSLFNNAKFMTSTDLEVRSRAFSQPRVTSNLMEAGQFFWSTGKPTKTNRTFFENIHPEKLEFNDNADEMFHDSVFIEGNYIAQKIADGSFLDERFEHGLLDSTPQPDWPNDLNESVKSKESVDNKTSTDSVFKTVDKLLPINIEVSKRNSSTKSSNASSKSRDAKHILQNLSDIFNTTHKSEKQKSEGVLLLNNLFEMLNETQANKDDGLDDSGNLSIIHNESDKNKTDSNVATNNKKETDCLQKIDSSVNSDIAETDTKKCVIASPCSAKKLPRKLEKRNSSIDINSSRNRNNSNSSAVKSNDSNGSSSNGPKIKSKLGMGGPKKGPLRAVIPVKEMKKGSCTPEKSEQKTVKLQSKKTSTPINEPKLKPVAASTPTLDDISNNSSPKCSSRKSFTNRSNSMTEQSSREYVNKGSNASIPTTSKLRRPSYSSPSSASKEKINGSPISVRFQDQRKIPPLRRNSVTEGIYNTQFRNTSAVKENGLMSSLRKVRENLLKSPYYNQKTGILVDSNNKIESNVEKKVTFRKSPNSSVKLKKINKENVG